MDGTLLGVSATLVARGLAAGHGARVLFSGLDLVVAPGDVVGLVGVNGAGKSTLLRTLAGEIPAEAGSVVVSPPSATLGYLPQEHERRPGETVLAALGRRTGVTAAHAAMDAATEELTAGARRRRRRGTATRSSTGSPSAAPTSTSAPRRWSPRSRPGVALDALMTGLSGGQAARVGLAALLLSRYDVLLLDEPTNDLDLAGLDQLERFVDGARARASSSSATTASSSPAPSPGSSSSTSPSSWSACTTAATTPTWSSGTSPGGTPARSTRSTPTRRRDSRRGPACSATGWPRASATRSRSPRTATSTSRRTTGRRRRSRRPRPSRPTGGSSGWRWSRSPARSGSCGWRSPPRPAPAPSSPPCAGPSSAAAGFTLGPVDLQVDWGDRLAITGANGSGKSTLLAALLGRVPLDEGTASLGPAVLIGEIDQARGALLRARAADRRLLRRGARLADVGGAHPAGQVRADRRPRAPAGRDALARGAHPGGARAAAGAGHQRAGARRADQPPRPAGDRAARGGAGRLHRARCCWSPTTGGCSSRCRPPAGSRSSTGRSPSAELVLRPRRRPCRPRCRRTWWASTIRSRSSPLRSRMWSVSSASPVKPSSVNSASAAPCSATTSTTSLVRPEPTASHQRAPGQLPAQPAAAAGRARPPAGSRRRGPTSPGSGRTAT